MNRKKRAIKISFPFGLYLKQLFSADTYVRYINPFSFWHRYKIDCLQACLDARSLASYAERGLRPSVPKGLCPDRGCGSHRCHEIDTVKYLENCRRLDYQAVKHIGIASNIDYADVSMDSLLRQTRSNTIYISQPVIKLKYRGVSYYTRDISNIYIHVVGIDPSIVKSNSLRCANNLDNLSTT